MTPDLRARLADARLYLCTDARREQGDLAEFLDAALAGGVDIVQLRDKGLEARQELAALEVFADAAARHGKLLAVNDRADVAHAARPQALHLGQDDLPVPAARAIVGDEMLIGRSCHAESEVAAAIAEPGVDYFCTGPTWPTPTKPGRPAPGWAWWSTRPGSGVTGRGSRSAGSTWATWTRCWPPALGGWWWSARSRPPRTREPRPPSWPGDCARQAERFCELAGRSR